MRAHPLVEQAHATLCRLADAPPATEAVKASIGDIERAWAKPFVVGIGGELPARTALLDVCCERAVFDSASRANGCAVVRIKRGPATSFRATRGDGSVEEHALPPDRTSEIAAARARAEAARGEHGAREQALVRVERALPARPAWWTIWMWPIYWLAAWRARGNRTERDRVARALAESRATLATIEADADATEAEARQATERYFETLKQRASSVGVVEVEVTLATSPLPANIELVDIADGTRAGADIDAVLIAQGDEVFAPVRGGHPLALGDHGQLLAALPALLADARALRLARRVETKIRTVLASLADAIERKEATFRARIDRVAALRVADPPAFVQAQLERVRGDISANVNTVVEHASVHLGSELAQLQEAWIGAVSNAPDADALKAALANIEEEWHARPRRIAEEVRVLVAGGLGGSARDIYPTVVEPLHAYGLPEAHMVLRAAPELPPLVLFPSLVRESSKLEKAGWLAGLFRSFEARRAGLREKLHEKIDRMREVAGSELLDAEPRLNQVIAGALAQLLEGALAHQQAWLDAAIAEERAQVTRDRASVTPLISVHDAVRAETYRLAECIAQLERQQPATAALAAAAETASPSR